MRVLSVSIVFNHINYLLVTKNCNLLLLLQMFYSCLADDACLHSRIVTSEGLLLVP